MSDTMDKLTGTLGEFLKKAKDLGAQAVETVDKNGTVRDAYARGTERTKTYAKIAKQTLELNRENDELRRIYTEIGKLCFEQAGPVGEGFFAPLFAQASETAEKIRALEEEIREMRDSVMPEGAEKDIEVEIGAFDDIVSADEDAARGE